MSNDDDYYAALDAREDAIRERQMNDYIHGGPEFHQDWMDYCEHCHMEDCECEEDE
jgi:hypothetical protein